MDCWGIQIYHQQTDRNAWKKMDTNGFLLEIITIVIIVVSFGFYWIKWYDLLKFNYCCLAQERRRFHQQHSCDCGGIGVLPSCLDCWVEKHRQFAQSSHLTSTLCRPPCIPLSRMKRGTHQCHEIWWYNSILSTTFILNRSSMPASLSSLSSTRELPHPSGCKSHLHPLLDLTKPTMEVAKHKPHNLCCVWCECSMRMWCVVSFRSKWHNSATNGTHGDLHIWRCCSWWGKSKRAMFRTNRVC